MSVSLDREFVGMVMLVGVIIGLSLSAVGAAKARTQTLLMGVCILFYSFTGLTYVPLMGSPADPIDLMSRMWGAMTAVIAGACVLGVIADTIAAARADREATGSRWTILLSMLAAVSLAAVYYSLMPYSDLPPSSDFLNEYGHLPGIFAYQLIFAIWIAVPAGTLGLAMAQTRNLGWPRWIVAAGGLTALVWGAWKTIGAVATLLGGAIPAASPVSVALGLSALVLCVTGLVIIGWLELRSGRRERAEYRRAREAEDHIFRSAGTTIQSD